MRKTILLLITLLFVLGCSAKDEPDNTIDKKLVRETLNKYLEDEKVEGDPLPFDIDEFKNKYNEAIEEFENEKDSVKMIATNESITLSFGNLTEALTLLNTLNDFLNDDNLSEFIEQFAKDVTNSNEYENEIIVSDVRIYINSLSLSEIMIAVSKME